jgi:hypothetical protein
MLFANLDMITRRTLLEKGLPLHFYLEFMLHHSAAVRELAKDTLQLVNYVELPVNSYGASTLPLDFMDEVAVCLPAGAELAPIPRKSSLNGLRNVDSDGQFVPWTQVAEDPVTGFFPGTPIGWQWYWNVNDFGEPTGRYFGMSGGVQYGYEIFRNRREIQFTDNFINSDGHPIMMYISNGQHVDNATQIDFRAFACIQAYGNWKASPNADMKDAPEARTFYNEKRLLRAEMNDLTVADIRNILYQSYTATYKT